MQIATHINLYGSEQRTSKSNTMKYLIIGLCALLVSFCNKEEGSTVNDIDYLVFGHFYGHCLGEDCVKMFKVTKDQLFEDTTDSYLATEFDFIELEEEKFELARELVQALPDQLLKEDKDTFGCPDCADQGGLYIEISNSGTTKSWRIDQNKSAVPGYLHDLMDQVNEVIDEL